MRQRSLSERPGVLFVVNSLTSGGAERHVVTLLNHLDASRYRLHLAYLKRDETLLPQLQAGRLEGILDCGVSRKVDIGAALRLSQAIDRQRIELLVCTNVYSTVYGFAARTLASRRCRIATVLHTTFVGGIKQQAAMQLYKQVAARCDLILYVSERQRHYWRRRGLAHARDAVEHNGIDFGYFSQPAASEAGAPLRTQLGFSPHDYVIGLCAALRPEKAHGDLLSALAELRAAGLPAKALLIGDGAERARIEHAAATQQLTDHVRITGFQRDVRPYIGVCDVMVLTSAETFSLAALESMACGKPVVLTDAGGGSEQIVHGVHGLLYPAGDVQGLVAQLTRLTAPAERAAMGAAAAERVRRCFTLERMVAGFAHRFDELLHGAQPPLGAAIPRA